MENLILISCANKVKIVEIFYLCSFPGQFVYENGVGLISGLLNRVAEFAFTTDGQELNKVE